MTRLAHYWSRSRRNLWRKGETSGMRQEVARILFDDDQDCEIPATPPPRPFSTSTVPPYPDRVASWFEKALSEAR